MFEQLPLFGKFENISRSILIVLAKIGISAMNVESGVIILLSLSLFLISGIGIARRSVYWISVTGILFGLFLSLVMVDESGMFDASDEHMRGAIYLLCMGIGFASITIMSRLFSDSMQLWPVVPVVLVSFASIVFLAIR